MKKKDSGLGCSEAGRCPLWGGTPDTAYRDTRVLTNNSQSRISIQKRGCEELSLIIIGSGKRKDALGFELECVGDRE